MLVSQASRALAQTVAAGDAAAASAAVGATSLQQAPQGVLAMAMALTATALGLAALCAGAGWWWAHQRYSQPLAAARQELQLLLQLTDAWVWQTDADHRLRSWRPPPQAPAASWQAGPTDGTLLWEAFGPDRCVGDIAGGGTLQAQLQVRAVVEALVVGDCRSAPALAARWCLSGRPRFDQDGRFEGYTGTARPLLPAQPGGPGQPAAPPLNPPAAAAPSAPAPAGALVGTDMTQAASDHADQESFIYSISHDLRAPIRVVDGFARILKEDYGRFLDRIGNDHVDRVLAAAARMNSMIDALLALSRLQSQPLQRQPVDLSQLAHYILEDLQREAPERESELRIEPGIVVQGDPTLLRIALENLLGNAWKYSGKCAHTQIDFRRESRNGNATLMVGDNGAGFDMRFSDRLFGVFQRLHSAKDFQGTGVGLASVRRIVRRHGGDIWAESEVGQGARFYFTLAH
jgi:signal transduction histidine kinase